MCMCQKILCEWVHGEEHQEMSTSLPFSLLSFTGFIFFWFNALHVGLLCFAPMSESEKEKKGRTSTSLLKYLKMSNR